MQPLSSYRSPAVEMFRGSAGTNASRELYQQDREQQMKFLYKGCKPDIVKVVPFSNTDKQLPWRETSAQFYRSTVKRPNRTPED